jgi:class 3 adenylate cyclase/tetratricopeptide (TPR) repeat protein
MRVCPACGEENTDRAKFCSECATPLTQSVGLEFEEERKVVSVLFCDLVGFTARSDRADPEDVRAALRPYHTRLRTEIERFGGTVEKFVGDAVMAVFGAPLAHEDDAERAVRTGLRILEVIPELNELQMGAELAVRIGVNTGETVVALGARPERGEGIVTGDVVNTASRLQSVAPVGGMVVGEQTYRATRDVFEYEQLEPTTVKGKTEPLRIWRALSARSRFGIETEIGSPTPLVGRRFELGMLENTFARALQEPSVQLVSIIGEPGVGKSRLVREFFSSVDERSELIAWRQGRCLPYGEGITFWALGEIVKAQAGILETDGPTEAVTKLRAAVGSIIEEPADRDWIVDRLGPLVGLEPEVPRSADRDELFSAWRRFLEGLAARLPTVLVFEDLHWADNALLGFLEHLVEWSSDVPLMLLCTARPELFDRHPEWGGGKRNWNTVALSPLSEQETAELVSGLVSRSVLSEHVRSLLVQRSEGNPLYAEEFVRMLGDREHLSQASTARSGAAVDLAFPETIQAVIAARLDTLAPERKVLLQNASVLGKVFWSGAVASISGLDEFKVREDLHELTRKELVRQARTSSVKGQAEYSFWHALVREVAYEQIPRKARAEKHLAAAAWIENLAADRIADHAEILAFHYEEALDLFAASGSDTRTTELRDQAIRFLILSGERALELDAGKSADLFGEAVELLGGERGQAWLDLAMRRGVALSMVGSLREASDVLHDVVRVADEIGDPRAEQRALAELGFIDTQLGLQAIERAGSGVEEAIAVLEEVQDDLGLAKAWRLKGWIDWNLGRGADAYTALGRALGHAIDAQDFRERAETLQLLSIVITWGPTPADEGLRRCEDLLRQARGHRGVEASVTSTRAVLSAMRGNIEEGRRLVRRAHEALTSIGRHLYAALVLAQEAGIIERLADDAEASERMHRKGIDLLEALGERSFQSTSLAMLADALYRQGGRDDEAIELTRQSEELGELDDVATQAFWRSVRAKVLARRGEHETAQALARDAMGVLGRSDLCICGDVCMDLVEVLRLGGRYEEALAACEQAAQLYEAKGNIVALALARAASTDLEHAAATSVG